MKAKELKVLVALAPVNVAFGTRAEYLECYPECGMRATITAVSIDCDDVARVNVDYSTFDAFNKSLETSSYYDSDRKPTLTAREAGQYKVTDVLYVSARDDLSQIFELLESDRNALIKAFEQSEKKNYIEWLEDIAVNALGLGKK